MHRSRLLLVVAAVSASILGGVAPAAARDGATAGGNVTSIDPVVVNRPGDRVRADFEYECWGTRQGNADVDLYQGGGVHYDGDAWLLCDGARHRVAVDLYRQGRQAVAAGKGHLQVELRDGRRALDLEIARVYV